MSEKEVSEEKIDKALESIMETPEEHLDALHIVKLLAKLIYNLRYDLNELKLKLVEAFKNSGSVDTDDIYLAYPNDIKKEIKRLEDEYFS